MKRLTILCAALTAAMFMNMSAYAGTSEVAAESVPVLYAYRELI